MSPILLLSTDDKQSLHFPHSMISQKGRRRRTMNSCSTSAGILILIKKVSQGTYDVLYDSCFC